MLFPPHNQLKEWVPLPRSIDGLLLTFSKTRVQTIFAGSSNEQKIFAAMAEWREKTCLKFVKRNGQKNYVEFIKQNTG